MFNPKTVRELVANYHQVFKALYHIEKILKERFAEICGDIGAPFLLDVPSFHEKRHEARPGGGRADPLGVFEGHFQRFVLHLAVGSLHEGENGAVIEERRGCGLRLVARELSWETIPDAYGPGQSDIIRRAVVLLCVIFGYFWG